MAFGKDGIVNVPKENNSNLTLYKLVDSKGQVVAQSYDKNDLQNKKLNLSQGSDNQYDIVESGVKCL